MATKMGQQGEEEKKEFKNGLRRGGAATRMDLHPFGCRLPCDSN